MEPQETDNNLPNLTQVGQPGTNQGFNQPQQVVQTVNQENSNQPKRFSKLPIIILIFIIIGIGIIVFAIVKPQINKDSESDVQTEKQSTTKQPSHYIGSQTIKLNDVSGGTNSGSVTRSITEGLVIHTLQAQLPDPEEGYIYQSWLIRNNENPTRYGILVKNEQAFYTFNTEFKFDPADPPFTTFETMHNTIVVSKESINDDDDIETKILEGTFTQ